MKTKKILVIGIVALVVCGVGLVIAQENLVKNNEAESTGGIFEAGISETELNNLIEAAKADNFIDPVTKEIDIAKLNNFTSPVMIIVEKLKANGYNDGEITEILGKYSMGYYPETGATWIGRAPTPEELQTLPQRKYPFGDVPPVVPSPGEQRNRVMEVVYDEWELEKARSSTIFYFLLLRNKNEEDHIGNGFNLFGYRRRYD